jgi:uncharacterized protein
MNVTPQDAILVENMHDIPYVKSSHFGPEVTACLTAATREVRKIIDDTNKGIRLGVQVLACGGKEALAVAKATQCNFIRNEGFVFSHIGDEGFIDSNAGEILRYRKMIDAGNVLVFSDIKKKHSSHSITGDVTLLETAFAASFFKADGIILTGRSTGDITDLDELNLICKHKEKLNVPVLVGSGVTKDNLKDYMGLADAVIVGSHFKHDGHWASELSEQRVVDFMELAKSFSK